jgi:hypothetical protein
MQSGFDRQLEEGELINQTPPKQPPPWLPVLLEGRQPMPRGKTHGVLNFSFLNTSEAINCPAKHPCLRISIQQASGCPAKHPCLRISIQQASGFSF